MITHMFMKSLFISLSLSLSLSHSFFLPRVWRSAWIWRNATTTTVTRRTGTGAGQRNHIHAEERTFLSPEEPNFAPSSNQCFEL